MTLRAHHHDASRTVLARERQELRAKYCERGSNQPHAQRAKTSFAMGGPRRTGPDSNSWLVAEWKRRGILDHTPTEAEMDHFMRASWFLRRNKNSPHVASTSNGDITPNRSWLARRNRSNSATQHSAGEPGTGLSRRNFLIDVVQGRLPKPPTLAVAREAGIPAPSAMKLQRAAPRQLPTEQQQERAFVFLTLYDLSACWNCALHHVGWGLYHSGVELCASAEHEGTEFTFDHHAGNASGVAWHAPYYSEQGRMDARSFAGGNDLPATPACLQPQHSPRRPRSGRGGRARPWWRGRGREGGGVSGGEVGVGRPVSVCAASSPQRRWRWRRGGRLGPEATTHQVHTPCPGCNPTCPGCNPMHRGCNPACSRRERSAAARSDAARAVGHGAAGRRHAAPIARAGVALVRL